MVQRIIKDYRQKYFWFDSSFLIIVAALVGIGTGFAAIGFQKMIKFFHLLFFDGGEKILSGIMGSYYVMLIPAIGGLIVGPIVYFFASEAKGHGVPEVMAAVAEKDGIIHPRVVVVRALASSISIGSGGSVGREGPIVQIGSAIGSAVGQILRLPPSILKTLVACGAAGGIAATFNAPIGGVLFAQELILGEFATNRFILIVISSVTSSIISRAFLGNYPAFRVPPYSLVSLEEMFFYLLLGILSGLFAVLYIKVLYKTEDVFDNIKAIPAYVKPIIGGLIVGCVGLSFPQVFGVGYDSIEGVLKNDMAWLLMFSLLFLKLFATSVTVASGGSGGVFAPGLFMGAMLGGSFGYIVHGLFPAHTAPAGAYALVGMGGVFAGMSQAPITGIIMLFEMTGDYMVVLPLMVVCVISSLTARGIYPETIYTEKLARRGLNVREEAYLDQIKDISVSDIMTTSVVTVNADMSLQEARTKMLEYSFSVFPVLRGEELLGLVTYEDILNGIKEGKEDCKVEQVTRRDFATVRPEDKILTVMKEMAQQDIGHIPVVSRECPCKLLGIITRSDIINAYGSMVSGERG
ncbi:chloride channel protein [Thermosyntropha sp.]|uniref:chloride channel protein n=1 Tax=Thermosyntropha sp. TaxID=2740820 RepID=UPI0025CE570A|nr:chloride channel protein [Thermosyntropha sp.]MBO8158170.1 chloride channel protein [Thermosyntropha sp.]